MVGMVLVGLLVVELGVYLDTLIEINGAVVGYTYIYLVPIFVHFTCIFKHKSSGYI